MRNPLKRNKTQRRIEYFRSTNKLWYFHLLGDGPRGEIIADSEGYTEKHDMMDTLNKYFPEWELIPGGEAVETMP